MAAIEVVVDNRIEESKASLTERQETPVVLPITDRVQEESPVDELLAYEYTDVELQIDNSINAQPINPELPELSPDDQQVSGEVFLQTDTSPDHYSHIALDSEGFSNLVLTTAETTLGQYDEAEHDSTVFEQLDSQILHIENDALRQASTELVSDMKEISVEIFKLQTTILHEIELAQELVSESIKGLLVSETPLSGMQILTELDKFLAEELPEALLLLREQLRSSIALFEEKSQQLFAQLHVSYDVESQELIVTEKEDPMHEKLRMLAVFSDMSTNVLGDIYSLVARSALRSEFSLAA